LNKKRVLVLGATGMIGHGVFKQLSRYDELDVFGTRRGETDNSRIRQHVDADNFDTIIRAFASIQPDIIINCIGIIKQNPDTDDYLTSITVNSQLPHRLSMITRAAKARMIQISTDCVFDGKKGYYIETDNPNAEDIYGKTKALGEVVYPPHCVTLRTSLIGHELKQYFGLVEWFLSQKGKINGFSNAIFSGITVGELARVIAKIVISNNEMAGLYHLSSNPISKYDLLNLIKNQYNKNIEIEKYEGFAVNRSLDSSKLRNEYGYEPPTWEELIKGMHEDYLNDGRYRIY